MDDRSAAAAPSCCASAGACVFTKALLARHASCTLARRHAQGEQELVSCASPVAHTNCETLSALLRERSTFALRLPRSGAPLMHARALQLQCGGVIGLQQVLQADQPDVHRLVGLAHERYGSLLHLPWAELVPVIAAWQPRRRNRRPAP